MKKIFTLIAAAMMAVSMMAETLLTIDALSVTDGDLSVVCDKAGGTTAPIVREDSFVRLYANNTVTITSTGANITKMVIGWSKNTSKGYAEATANCGEYDDPESDGSKVVYGNWSGSAKTIVFTIGTGQKQLHSIEFTMEGETGEKCPKAIFSLDGETLAEGATIDNAEYKSLNVNFELPDGIEATSDLIIEGVLTGDNETNNRITGWTDFEDGVDVDLSRLVEGEYTISITHVAYGKQIGMTEEWDPIYEHDFVAEEGKALASLHFTIKAAVECPEEGHLFTAAEAKEAYNNECLKKDDVIAIKGYIANMFLKPNNFTRFGSVTIWLTDTLNGNAREFELYNCYGFMGDTLATYEVADGVDATDGSKNYDVTSVTGRNGMIYRVGDYVEATGKFTLYNGTYELNTGCYLTTEGVAPIDVTGAETFEGINLADGAYINNAGEDGVFTFGDYHFTNYYDDGYSFWNGFAVSKTTDNTYSILADQYNSCRGGGMDSKTFLVGYYSEYNQAPTITADKLFTPEYVCVTNSAWALTSMRDGDSFAKKFDETDFLSLTATGYDEKDEETGSATIYLAKDGKILNQWVKWDLSEVGKCFYMEFTMDCSDKSLYEGNYSMNTPAYFCLDNFKATLNDAPTAINNAVETVRAEKRLVNGEVIIVRDGVRYNVLGARK